MSEPISSSSSPFSAPPPGTDVPSLAQHMQKQVDLFSQQLSSVLEDSTLTSQPPFLQEVAKTVSQLNQLVEQAISLGEAS